MQNAPSPTRLILFDTMTMLVFAAVLAADQLTKVLVRAAMAIGEAVPAEGFLRLHHVTNSGAIFGLFPDRPAVMTVASCIGILALLYFYHFHAGRDWRARMSMGLLLGGALGNLIDRFFRGSVTDFIDVGAWPVFNLADSAVVAGVITLAVAYLFPTFLMPARDADAALPLGNASGQPLADADVDPARDDD